MDWKLKLDEEGHVVLADGKPVYIDPDGKEITLDPPQMYGKIIDLGKENKGHRERADALETNAKIFEEIEDLPEWKVKADAALETVANFNEKDWLKADKVEKLKAEMKDAYDEQESNLKKSYETKQGEYEGIISKKELQIRKLMVSNKFATSPYFNGKEPKTNLPPEIAETYFGKHFKVEEGDGDDSLKLVAYYTNGDQIFSRQNPGDPASFDEAMTAIFDGYPGKERLLRATGSGSGGSGGSGGGGDDPNDEVKQLEAQYAKATESGDARTAIAIKNKIFAAKQKAA